MSEHIEQEQNSNMHPLQSSDILFLLVSYVTFLRRTRAAILIQRNMRMWAARRRYQQQRTAAVTIQCFLRAYMARKQYYTVMWLRKMENKPREYLHLHSMLCNTEL